LHDFEGASAERPRLVEQLLHARLLSLQIEGQGEREVERVSIIHEALIARWERLKDAIQASRDRLRRRARFELDLNEWQLRGGDLLSGGRLADALALQRDNDPVVGSEAARRFLALSQERFAEEQRRIVIGRLRKSALRGLAGGALGFGLAFLAAYLPQVPFSLTSPSFAASLFTRVVGAIFMAASGAVAGLIFSLGFDLLQARTPGWSNWLRSGLLGAFAFAIPLLFNTFLLTAGLRFIDTLLAVFQGGLWGFTAGIGAWWVGKTTRAPWLSLAMVSLAAGLSLCLGQRIGEAFGAPGLRIESTMSNLESIVPIFLAGAIAPLMLLLIGRFARPKEVP
jgi:hypothetical protein